MSEEKDTDERCVICLEILENEKEHMMLANKFGCNCKQSVHEDCLTIWIIRNIKNTNKRMARCIMCRCEVEIGKIDRSDLNENVLSNIVTVNVNEVFNLRREPYSVRDIIRMSICGAIMFSLIILSMMALMGVFR